MWNLKTYGIFGSPHMGKHIQLYQFKRIKILVMSMLRDKDHVNVDPWWKFVYSVEAWMITKRIPLYLWYRRSLTSQYHIISSVPSRMVVFRTFHPLKENPIKLEHSLSIFSVPKRELYYAYIFRQASCIIHIYLTVTLTSPLMDPLTYIPSQEVVASLTIHW